jgi:hypothetical protein
LVDKLRADGKPIQTSLPARFANPLKIAYGVQQPSPLLKPALECLIEKALELVAKEQPLNFSGRH